MAIVFAAPNVTVAVPRAWVGLQMTWTGWDGSVWNLTKASEGVVMMAGVRGLTMPPVTHYKTSYASVSGARWRGHNVDSREVFWPIQVYCDTDSQEWIRRDRAFWRTMRPGKVGTWTVIQPSGEKRYLDLRFTEDSDQAYNHDPALRGWSNYGIMMVADDPFWRTDSIRREWATGMSTPFFDSEGGTTGLTISPSTTLATAAMLNPGDVDAYPVWEVYGPVTNAQVGVGDKLIVIPFAVADGEVLVIDTDPTQQSAMLHSSGTVTDKTAQLGTAIFAPMPADSISNVSLVLGGGAGKIRLTMTPLYLRAW